MDDTRVLVFWHTTTRTYHCYRRQLQVGQVCDLLRVKVAHLHVFQKQKKEAGTAPVRVVCVVCVSDLYFATTKKKFDLVVYYILERTPRLRTRPSSRAWDKPFQVSTRHCLVDKPLQLSGFPNTCGKILRGA